MCPYLLVSSDTFYEVYGGPVSTSSFTKDMVEIYPSSRKRDTNKRDERDKPKLLFLQKTKKKKEKENRDRINKKFI